MLVASDEISVAVDLSVKAGEALRVEDISLCSNGETRIRGGSKAAEILI